MNTATVTASRPLMRGERIPLARGFWGRTRPELGGEQQLDHLEVGREVDELRPANDLLGDPAGLRARLDADGYLFIRSFHPAAAVARARRRVLQHLAGQGLLDPAAPLDAGRFSATARSLGIFREVGIAHSPEVLGVVDGAHTVAFFTALFGGPVATYDKRWLRAMARGGSNGLHNDRVYMGRGSPRVLTMWTSLTAAPIEQGPLVIVQGSHRQRRIIETYGALDVDRDHVEAVFTDEPRELVERFGLRFATANFDAGDALIFGLDLMHASVPNRSDRYRISIDVRYQPADEPRDHRFLGADGNWLGNYHWQGPEKPMAELRKNWGL